MAITDRTRKILWGRSGNLCAYCRRVLVEDGANPSDESVVGDECHLIGERPDAARGHLGVGRDDLDESDNLVLLCEVHHKLVDDQPETYTVEILRAMKAAHELWVKEKLARKPGGKQPHFALSRTSERVARQARISLLCPAKAGCLNRMICRHRSRVRKTRCPRGVCTVNIRRPPRAIVPSFLPRSNRTPVFGNHLSLV
jgi:hypothetical protein